MRSQNIKCKSSSFGRVGCVSCLLLLLLTFLSINPAVSLSAFADERLIDGNTNNEEPDEGFGGNAADGDGSASSTVSDDDTGMYVVTSSTVNIAFSSSSASGQVTPIDSTNGDKAKVDVQATVSVQNSGGYSVYVGSNSSQLSDGKGNAIDSVTSATAYANLPLNRWGYSFQEGTTVKDSYEAMPDTLRSSAKYTNSSTNITSETKIFMLSFAARIGSNMPAGTYSNSVTMSVVSSPLEITVSLADISTMQEMTPNHCIGTVTGTSKQLKDTRDGKFYWVSKLADGKCWMTQNLDLDLKNGTTLSSATSDLGWDGAKYPATAKTWNPPYTTATTITDQTILADNTGTKSWSLGNYRITNPDTSSDCGSQKNSAANCTSQFTAYNTPTTANNNTNAHYILGNHYQWNAVTAGTGGTITSGQATDSICPRNWRLPTSDTGGELGRLVIALGGTLSTDNVTKAPFYGVRGGVVRQTANELFRDAGGKGFYWSSTPSSTGIYTYYLTFYDTGANIYLSGTDNRYNGFSVRCVAR